MGGPKKAYSRERRRKIGDGVSQRYHEVLHPPLELPEKKRCSHCKRFKVAAEFKIRKRKLKSGIWSRSLEAWCRECSNLGVREWRERKRLEGELQTLQRAYHSKWYKQLSSAKREEKNRYQREWMAIRRREEGRPVRGSRREDLKAERRGSFLSTGPLIELLQRELALIAQTRNESNKPDAYESKGIGILAELSGLSGRRIYAILHKQERVALSTVDKLLCALDLPHMLSVLYPEN